MSIKNTLNPESKLHSLVNLILSVKMDENVNENDRITLERIAKYGVHPAYVSALEDSASTGHAGSIKVKLTVRLLLAMCLANKRNRSRTMSHCEALAMSFRSGWEYGLTDYAITRDGMTCNGGHSSFATLLAFVPIQVFEWFDICLRESPVKGDDGEVKLSSDGQPVTEMVRYCPAKPGRKLDDGSPVDPSQWSDVDLIDCSLEQLAEIEAADDEAKLDWLQDQLVLNLQRYGIPESEWFVKLTTQQPNDIVTKFDTLSRGRQGSEQLELFQPTRHYIESTSVFESYKMAQQVLKCCHLRSKVKPAESDSGYVTYGTPKGGGNCDPSHFPAFFLSFLEGIKELENYLDSKGKNSIVDLRHDDWKAIPEKDLLVVCIMSKPVAMRRLLAAIARGVDHEKTPDALGVLADRFVKPKRKTAYFQRPTATQIQASLFAIANNGAPDFDSDTPIEHQIGCRGNAWDVGKINSDDQFYWAHDVNQNADAVFVQCGSMVDQYFGDTTTVAASGKAKRRNKRRVPAAKK